MFRFSTREDLLGLCKPSLWHFRARDFSVQKGRACANRVYQAVFQQRAKSGLGMRLGIIASERSGVECARAQHCEITLVTRI